MCFLEQTSVISWKKLLLLSHSLFIGLWLDFSALDFSALLGVEDKVQRVEGSSDTTPKLPSHN